MKLNLRDDLAQHWQEDSAFDQAAKQTGDIYRAREGRRTLRFEAGANSYFLKYHAGIGWQEVVKNLSQGKLPIISAMSEVRAIEALQQAGLDTMTIAAYGERGFNPAHIESFIVTDDLANTQSLEDVADSWQGKLPLASKRLLIKRLAEIASRMHSAGINHRDFYLCHFLFDKDAVEQQDWSAPCYLIDLHRSQVRKRVPIRWLTKDLGGLYFSAVPLALSRTDVFRFIRDYTGQSPAKILRSQPGLWRACWREASKIYRRSYGQATDFPLAWQPVKKESESTTDKG